MHRVKQRTTQKDIYVEEYPDLCAGAPVGPEKYSVETRDLSNHPLADPRLFETAHWLGNASISDEYRKEFFLHENVCLIWPYWIDLCLPGSRINICRGEASQTTTRWSKVCPTVFPGTAES
jgi:hypothetical protein